MLMVVAVAVVLVVASAVWFSPLPVADRLGFRNYFGAVLLIAWLAAAGAEFHGDKSRPSGGDESELMAAVRSLGPIDWEATPAQREPAAESGTGDATAMTGADGSSTMDVAPVASLIGGLESRLAEQPDDAKGWALLAQSYAFVGRVEDAQSAVAHAVELGFDEASLQSRVQAATRELHGSNWIEQAISR